MPSAVNIIDPRKIVTDYPWLVFANNTIQIVAKLIDFETDLAGYNAYNHAMLSIDPGKFVAQNMTLFNAYREVPMENYMVNGQQLAFVSFVNNNPAFAAAFRQSVLNRLDRPGWLNCYDFLGVFGQAVGKIIPGAQNIIHTPGLEYCSVDVLRHAVNACPKLPKPDQQLINNIPPETNPEAFWKIVVDNPSVFNIYGYWNFRTGITV